MNLYLVTADKFDYDQYDSFVVWAPSPEAAVELVKSVASDSSMPSQTWTAVKVSAPSEPTVLLGSFNAGRWAT